MKTYRLLDKYETGGWQQQLIKKSKNLLAKL